MKLSKLFLILSTSFMVSCTNGFEELNTNPLAINNASPNLLLPIMEHYGFHSTAAEYQRVSILYSGEYCQYLANTSTSFTSGNYIYNSKWTERGFWTPYYQKQLKNLRLVHTSLQEHPEYSDMYQIMRIVTAMGTIRMTDTFGDMPYSKAGYGDTQAAYDSQKDIYYDVFKELSEAVALLKQKRNNQLNYGEEDLIYKGDVDKWIKLANSLRLRAAIRLSYIDPQKAKEEGEAALKAALFSSNADNAALESMVDKITYGHPFVNCSFYNEFKASETMVNILRNTSSIDDPRLPLILSKTEAWIKGEKGSQEYKGLPNGVSASELSQPAYTNMNNSGYWSYMWGFKLNNATFGSGDKVTKEQKLIPLVIMNYAEVCFLKAEAALRNWSGAGEAKDNYEAGIRASFEELRTYAPKDSYACNTQFDETYITTGKVKWEDGSDFETKLEQIITQKWLGIFPNSVEAWAEFRRTGYPTLQPIKQSLESSINAANGEFIKKLRYVDNELINNSANSQDPDLNGGKGDGVNVRVWWDTARYK